MGVPGILMSKAADAITSLSQRLAVAEARARNAELLSEAHADDTQDAAALWRAAEAQLAHAEPNSVRRTYNHATYLEERRDMMQAWADKLEIWKRESTGEVSRTQ